MDDGKFRYALMVLFMFPWSLCGWMTVIVTPSCVDSFLCYRSNYLAISSILFFSKWDVLIMEVVIREGYFSITV